MQKKFILGILFFIALVSHPVCQLPWDNGKIIVSENNRFLQHKNGTPFFWLGDTGWKLFQKMDRDEAQMYFMNRHSKGFNVIQCVVTYSMPSVNIYGDSAFAGGNPAVFKTTPGNSPYDSVQYDFWDHIDFMVDEAAKNGIYLAMVPVWGDVVKQGFMDDSIAKQYATLLAERYKDKPNIFWINGGNIAGVIKKDVWDAIGNTIHNIDTTHLMTFHPLSRTQSSIWFNKSEWLDFNMFHSGHWSYEQDDSQNHYGEDNWRYVLSDLNKRPLKPTLDGEPSYESIPQGLDTTKPCWTARDIRRYAYWSAFAGACGFTYGNNAIMQIHKWGDTTSEYGAKRLICEAIEDSGSYFMKYFKNLMMSRPFMEGVFDISSGAGNNGEKYDRIIVNRGAGYLMAYTYTGRTFSLNLGKISGEVLNMWWFDPRTGEFINIDIADNKGIQTFDPPGEPEEGNDWVLVLDDIDVAVDPPGYNPE